MGKERASELDRVKDEDLGDVLGEEIRKFLESVGVPRGLAKVGYGSSDVAGVSIHSFFAIYAHSYSLLMGAYPNDVFWISHRSYRKMTRRKNESNLHKSLRDLSTGERLQIVATWSSLSCIVPVM
jgi:hypothetical protein